MALPYTARYCTEVLFHVTEQINLLDQLFNHIPWTDSNAGAIADSLIASLRGASPRNAYLYHFDGSMESSGLKSLGITAVTPNYSDASKFGKAAYVNSQDAVPLAIGISGENIPVLDGDFTIQFWAKIKNARGYLFMAQKYMGTAQAVQLFDSTNVVNCEGYQTTIPNSGNAKYAGLSIYSENGLKIRMFSKDLSKAITINVAKSDGALPIVNDWHQYTLCRKNSELMFYFDGNKVFTAPVSDELYFPDQVSIGAGFLESDASTATTPNYSHASSYPIYVDELLIDDTTCLYTEDFTPSNSPYSDMV